MILLNLILSEYKYISYSYNFLKTINLMQKDIDINAVIGFSGHTYDGLLLHPDNEHIIYPLGSTVVVRHILTRSQTFLRGHDNKISCNFYH